jgi:hypothetical protein
MAQSPPYGDRTPEYWRAHAEEARTRADEMKDGEGKKMMLQVASLYDDMAIRLEREARHRTILGHSAPRVVHEQQQPQQQKGKNADGEE